MDHSTSMSTHLEHHPLFQKERIAFGPSDQELRERLQMRVVPKQRLQEFVGTYGRQRVQAQLRVEGFAAPAMLILRAIVDQQQESGRRQTLYQAVEQCLRL